MSDQLAFFLLLSNFAIPPLACKIGIYRGIVFSKVKWSYFYTSVPLNFYLAFLNLESIFAAATLIILYIFIFFPFALEHIESHYESFIFARLRSVIEILETNDQKKPVQNTIKERKIKILFYSISLMKGEKNLLEICGSLPRALLEHLKKTGASHRLALLLSNRKKVFRRINSGALSRNVFQNLILISEIVAKCKSCTADERLTAILYWADLIEFGPCGYPYPDNKSEEWERVIMNIEDEDLASRLSFIISKSVYTRFDYIRAASCKSKKISQALLSRAPTGRDR